MVLTRSFARALERSLNLGPEEKAAAGGEGVASGGAGGDVAVFHLGADERRSIKGGVEAARDGVGAAGGEGVARGRGGHREGGEGGEEKGGKHRRHRPVRKEEEK